MGMRLTREKQVYVQKLASTEMLQDNIYSAEDHTCVQKSMKLGVGLPRQHTTSPYC